MKALPLPYRLVVFDWDGTLVDSIGNIVACTREALTESGLDVVDGRRVRPLVGSGLLDSIRALAPAADEPAIESVVAAYRRLWLGKYHSRSPLFPGAFEAVAALRESGRMVAVATAKSRRGLRLDLDRTGVGALLDASRTADEAPVKPSPAMLLEILDELGVRPASALMVGDSLHDLQMATNAGVAAVAVTSGAAPASRLASAGPLACLDSVADLPAWMETIR